MELAKLTVDRLLNDRTCDEEDEKNGEMLVIEAFENVWTVMSSFWWVVTKQGYLSRRFSSYSSNFVKVLDFKRDDEPWICYDVTCGSQLVNVDAS